ncbi:MAG: C4-dicarboxylate ABC transporter substrate-binding protein [Azospirillum brasilense]|nr:MAG: C4-dicarboxylate ABC transporter substrate-binding protein [Azospirillum brasilense]
MLPRRTFFIGASIGLLPFAAISAESERYPSLHVFIPGAPAGGWDSLGRAIEQVCRQTGMVGSFQFENVGGAGGTVGLPRFASQRRGRGNSILVGGAVMVGAAIANKSPASLRDLTPIARMVTEPGIIVVPAESEFKTLADFLEALKTRPGATSVAGGSAGGMDHILLGSLLRSQGRTVRDASYVAFAGGGAAQAAILGAQVKAGISGYSEFAEQIKAGRMRALATSGETRSVEGIPTLKESGLDIVTGNWRGVFGAPALRESDRAKLVTLMTDLNARPEWKALLERQGWDNAFLSGDAFTHFIAEDQVATEQVLRDLGLV